MSEQTEEVKTEEAKAEESKPEEAKVEKPKKKAAKKAAKKKADIALGDLQARYESKEITSIVECLSKLMVKFGITRASYNPRLQAFELYKEDRQVDCIEVNELIKEFSLGFKLIKGQIRKYQKPTKRAYTLGVKYE